MCFQTSTSSKVDLKTSAIPWFGMDGMRRYGAIFMLYFEGRTL